MFLCTSYEVSLAWDRLKLVLSYILTPCYAQYVSPYRSQTYFIWCCYYVHPFAINLQELIIPSGEFWPALMYFPWLIWISAKRKNDWVIYG